MTVNEERTTAGKPTEQSNHNEALYSDQISNKIKEVKRKMEEESKILKVCSGGLQYDDFKCDRPVVATLMGLGPVCQVCMDGLIVYEQPDDDYCRKCNSLIWGVDECNCLDLDCEN